MTDTVRAALDIHALQVDGFADRGIGRYVTGYSVALARAGRVAAALLAPDLPPAFGLPGELVGAGLVCWDSLSEARRLLGEPGRIAYHVTAPFLHTGLDDPAGLGVVAHWAECGAPRVVLLHDLIPLRAPRHYLPIPAHEERYRTRARWVGTADLILTNSEHTRQEAVDLLDCSPDQVVTVGAGVSPYFCPPDGTDDELWRFHLGALEGRPYVLTIGGSDARKGTERLIAAVGQIAARDRDLHLVVVGHLTPAWRRRLDDAARASGLGGRVVVTGPVGDELLRACYRRALVTVMPSLAEGSGLPVLESAACGTPALASSTTSLVEVAATPLAGFDPTDVDSIAEAIAGTLGDDGRRDAILAAQQTLVGASTWEAVAARAATALDRLPETVPARSWGPCPLGPKVAIVGPLPPEGGIGAYNRRLLASFRPNVQVAAIGVTLSVPELPPGVGYVAASAFGTDVRPCSFDGVLYALGNSAGHLATVELALRYPGWLWLHEVRLPAIATTALDAVDDDQFAAVFARLLDRAYPGRPPLESARRAGRSNLDLIDAGVGLVAPLAERSRGILVNSELARRLLLLDLAPLAHHPPIHVVPPACPPLRVRSSGVGLHGATNGSVGAMVVAFGVVSMSKRPDLLVDAVALAGCRLTFVGPCPPILAQVIHDRARARGVEERVEVVGAVDDDGWRAWMDRAALVVQLRESTSGESSAAVLEALSSGVPVITNIASAREWPHGTVSLADTTVPLEVAGRIDALLRSPDDLDMLSAGGQQFAADHQFGHLAEALVSIVAQV